MADSVATIPAAPGSARLALLAGVASGLIGTALFQLISTFVLTAGFLDSLIMAIPVGLVFGMTLAYMGRRHAGMGPIWGALIVLLSPIVYLLAALAGALAISFCEDLGLRMDTLIFGAAGALAGAAGATGLLAITVFRRRGALAGAAMVIVVSAIVGAVAMSIGLPAIGEFSYAYYAIHAVWQAAFLSSFLFNLASHQPPR